MNTASAPPPADILVIDDEVQIRRLLRLTLETAGYAVREAENGSLAAGSSGTRSVAAAPRVEPPAGSRPVGARQLSRQDRRAQRRRLPDQTVLRDVWGPAHETDTHYLRVHMANLRKYVEATPDQPQFLKTESGVGYRFAE